MSRERFLGSVEAQLIRDGLRADAEALTRAVFETLHHRLSFGQVLEVSSELPPGLDTLWEVSAMERVSRFLGGSIPLERDDFLERVRSRVGLSNLGEARIAACAVFTALKRQLPRARRDEVGSQLPVGLRELWESA